MPERRLFVTHLQLLFVAIVWGANFVAMKYLIDEMGAFRTALARILLAAIVFGLILIWSSRPLPRMSREIWRLMLVVALFGGVTSQIAVAIGTGYLGAGLASLIVTSAPIFIALTSRALIGEPLGRLKIVGITVAFSGFLIVLLFGGRDASFSVNNTIGVLVMLVGPSSWAIATVISKPLMTQYEPKFISGLSMVIGGIMFVPLVVTQRGIVSDIANLDGWGWFALLTTSVLAIVIAYRIWYQAVHRLSPTRVAVYIYLVPFFAIVSAWLVLGETITIWVFLGGMTIMAGVIITNSSRSPMTAAKPRSWLPQPLIPQPVTQGKEPSIGNQ